MEHSFISAEGQASANQTSVSSDKDLAGLRELTAAIHANGSPVFAQLNHAGSAAKEEVTGYVPLAPSALKHPKAKDDRLPKAMTAQDLEKVIADFKEAARRAQAAGFDGVEIHSAHGYLLNQFYSPLTNHRTDEYGGTLENRIRLHCQIIEAIRSQVGTEYPLALRLGACEGLVNGSTVEDAVSACVQFEKAGVDLIDITGGFCLLYTSNLAAYAVYWLAMIVVSRRLTQPVEQLAEGERQIAGGRWSQRVPVSRAQELKALAENFNRMAETVEQKVAELETENQEKEIFINNLSHEMKTPLTSILGYTQLLRRTKMSPL